MNRKAKVYFKDLFCGYLSETETGYAFGYGYESLFGPLEIKHSWSPETRNHFTWISLGFWF
jgi:NTE family protein